MQHKAKTCQLVVHILRDYCPIFQIYYSYHAAGELRTVLEIEQTRLTMTSRLTTSFYRILYKKEYHSLLSARMHISSLNS